MAHEYKLTLTMKDTGQNVSVSGEFEDEDWERLEEFAQYADELLHTKLVQDGMTSSLKIKWEQKTGLVTSADLPPWDDVTVFLHKFRPLGLQSEPTYFYNICNVLAKELVHPDFHLMIDDARQVFGGKRLQRMFTIQIDDEVLNSEKVLYDWLNAYEYHRNEEKRKLIDSLTTILPLEASKAIFLGLLTEKAKGIHALTALIRVVIGKQKSVESYIRRSNINLPVEKPTEL